MAPARRPGGRRRAVRAPQPGAVDGRAAEGFGSAADATEFYTAAFRALVGALARKADGLEDAVRPCRRLQDLARSWAALTYLGDALGELSYGGPSGLRSRLDWIARRLDRHEDHAAALAARIGRVRRCADDRAVAAARALARELRSAANHAARGDVETAGFHAHDAFETFFLALGVETSPSGR